MAMLKDDYGIFAENIDAEIGALGNENFNLGESKLYNLLFDISHISFGMNLLWRC